MPQISHRSTSDVRSRFLPAAVHSDRAKGNGQSTPTRRPRITVEEWANGPAQGDAGPGLSRSVPPEQPYVAGIQGVMCRRDGRGIPLTSNRERPVRASSPIASAPQPARAFSRLVSIGVGVSTGQLTAGGTPPGNCGGRSWQPIAQSSTTATDMPAPGQGSRS